MNVLQIMRQAEFEIDSIRSGNVRSGMWTAEEVLSAVNVSMDRTARLLRLAGSDILTKVINSDDSGSDLISEVYSPTLSLKITADVNSYVLPPDFVRVAAIRPRVVTSGFQGVRFKPISYSDPAWVDLKTTPTEDLVSDPEGTYYYVVQGNRTLRISPTPKDTFDIELTYHYRAPRLRYYSTGTIQRTSGAVGVTGGSTAWLAYGLRTPAELIPSVTSLTGITMDEYYPVIKTIDTATTLTLARESTTTDGVGITYTIAMVPVLPEEHHTWLAQLTAATMYRKVDADISAKMQMDLAQQLLEQIVPEITLRQLQESLISQAFEIWK